MRVVIVALSLSSLLVDIGAAAAQRPAATPTAAAATAPDWNQWRGPNRDAKSTETGLLREWPKDGPKLLWNSREVNKGNNLGRGYSSLAIVGGRIYTVGDREGHRDPGTSAKTKPERGMHLVCLEEATGKELWVTLLSPSWSDGPRCTPTVDGNRVYTLTPLERDQQRTGFLSCVDAVNGKLLWQKNLLKEYGGQMQSGWNYSESPTIDVDKVVVTPGGKSAAMVALNKVTGDVIWKCEAPRDCGAGYASIVVAECAGVKQYITLMGPPLGVVGVDAYSGKFLWNYAKVTNGTAAIPTPLVQGDFVFASSGYGTGAALLKLVADSKGGVKAQEQYFLPGGKLQNHHGGMVMLGDYIYGGHGHNDGRPFCLEWKTGKMKWGPETNPAGSASAAVLYADGRLYFRWQTNLMGLIEATPKGHHLISEFQLPKGTSNPGWQHPVIHDGKLFIRGNDQVLCYDIRSK